MKNLKAHKCNFLVGTKVCRIENVPSNHKLKIKTNEFNIDSSP